ncbi:MAG: 4'-phosphopantetheinyl transferase superfamily protein [Microbacterium chocolatum]|nr:4'-phosphopantetheinyl transferase superfamily protein [Microbacterium chocolatum]
MTFVSAHRPSVASVAEGRWPVLGTDVWWRFGRVGGEPRRVAYAWVEHLVRSREGLPWRGLHRESAAVKPRLVGSEGVDFSISHSGDAVLVAVARGVRVGADVEAAPFAAFDSKALRRRMLTPAEAEELPRLRPEDARTHLARLWTAKEAGAKATGEGLASDFRTLAVSAPPTWRGRPVEACLAVIDDHAHPTTRHLALETS